MEDEDWPMTYSIKDRNGQDYEIKDIERFAKHISKNHSSGVSIHEENGYYFTVDDAFREKILKFAAKEKVKSVK